MKTKRVKNKYKNAGGNEDSTAKGMAQDAQLKAGSRARRRRRSR